MNQPNTTQIPNKLFDKEMTKMKDTELRLVLIVMRKTMGWIQDHKTGMRKTEDWISHSQLKKISGRSGRSLSSAIDNCIKKGWIQARDKKGNILDTKNKRVGKKIYYRTGEVFITSEKSSEVSSTSEKSSIENFAGYKTKRNTKDFSSKEERGDSQPDKELNKMAREIIDAFQSVNPSYKNLFKMKQQHGASRRLIKEHGFDVILNTIKILPKIVEKPYAPKPITPYQLERDLGKIKAFLKQEKNKVETKGKNIIS